MHLRSKKQFFFTIVWTVFWISLQVIGFNTRETRTAIKCLSGYTFRTAEALTPEDAVYTDSVALGLCCLRDAIPFSATSRVWETQRKITEYRGCASVFVNKSLRWRHRLTVYATAEGSQRRHFPISKIVQTILRFLIIVPNLITINTKHLYAHENA